MKGLSSHELTNITEFIQKHHKFGHILLENRINDELGYCIKYIDVCYDSRQSDYWSISFRGGYNDITFSTNSFLFGEKPKGFEYMSLYDWIMAFLKYEWKPEGKEYHFMGGKREGKLNNKN